VQPVGDVVHVFSHIKKTYRVQWVLLEGTPDPPQLALTNALEKNTNVRKNKGKGKPGKTDKESDVVIPCSTWVPLNAVATKK
jgi:A/G-specific adenine glycosylase